MKKRIYEVLIEENSGKREQQYYGEDGQLALEILSANTDEFRTQIKAGTAKAYMICK